MFNIDHKGVSLHHSIWIYSAPSGIRGSLHLTNFSAVNRACPILFVGGIRARLF